MVDEKDKEKVIVVPANELVPMGRILRELMDLNAEKRKQTQLLERIWNKVKGLPY